MKAFKSILLWSCVLLGLCGCVDASNTETTPATTEPALLKQLEEPDFDYIAYSRIDKGDQGSINTQEHLRYCASLPFTTLKADVQPTSDGGLVLCHDTGFTFKEGKIVAFNKEDNVPIYDLTTKQCLELKHSATYNGKHCKITDFETYIRICKEFDKWAFITVRDQHIDEVIAAVMPVLEKYGWVQNSIINSFTVSTLEAFRAACPEIKLSYVLQLNKPVTREYVDTAVRLGNCIVTSFHFRVSDTQTGWNTMEASKDGIAYASSKGVRVYQAQVAEGVDVEKLKDYGYSGAQMRYVADFS